jgi:hypothetical protein
VRPKVLVSRKVFEEALALLNKHFDVESNQRDIPFTPAQLTKKRQGKSAAIVLLTDIFNEICCIGILNNYIQTTDLTNTRENDLLCARDAQSRSQRCVRISPRSLPADGNPFDSCHTLNAASFAWRKQIVTS